MTRNYIIISSIQGSGDSSYGEAVIKDMPVEHEPDAAINTQINTVNLHIFTHLDPVAQTEVFIIITRPSEI